MTRRTLGRALPAPIHETVQRAQTLRSENDPDYPSDAWPQPIPCNDRVPLPDDRCDGWNNIDTSAPGELVHVALFVHPDAAIDRVAALGTCVSTSVHDEYHTIGEVIYSVPDESNEVEQRLFERFLAELFEMVETVAAVGDPTAAVIYCYTYSDHEKRGLAEGLDRHAGIYLTAHARSGTCYIPTTTPASTRTCVRQSSGSSTSTSRSSIPHRACHRRRAFFPR